MPSQGVALAWTVVVALAFEVATQAALRFPLAAVASDWLSLPLALSYSAVGLSLLRFAWAAAFLAGLAAAGERLLGRSGAGLSAWEKRALGLGAGLMLLVYATWLAGWSIGYGGAALRSLGAAIAALGVLSAWAAGPWERPKNLWLGLLAPIAVLGVLAACLPEVFYDALVYHLAVPQRWLFEGRIIPIESNLFALSPQPAGLIYLWGLAADPYYLPKALDFMAGAATAWILYAWTAEKAGPRAGALAAALWACAPLVVLGSWSSGTELWCALAIALAWLALERDCVFLSGLLFGFAATFKITALFGAPVVALWLFLRRRKDAGLWAAGLFLPFVPWLIQRWRLGQPLLFPLQMPEAGALGRILQAEFHNENAGLRPFRGWPWLAWLWDSLAGADAGRHSFLGPMGLALLPFAALAWNDARHGWARRALGYSAAAIGLTCLATNLARHGIMHAVPLCAALALAADKAKPWTRGALAALALSNAFWLAAVLEKRYDAFDVLEGGLDARAYLAREHGRLYPDPSFEALRRVPTGRRVLIVGDARSYYSPGPAAANSAFDFPPIFAWAESPERLERELSVRKFGCLLVNWQELQRLTPRELLLGDRWGVVARWLKAHARVVYADQQATLYDLL